jgi:putative oxidoreductase
MDRINDALQWLDDNQNLAYSLIRFFIGTALFVRGWIFFADPGTVTELAREESLFMWFSYVTFGHLIGGMLLMAGLLTRLAAILQIPILIGAVFIVNAGQKLASVNQSLELAVMVLVLLIIYSLFGSGSFSLDRYLADKKAATKS